MRRDPSFTGRPLPSPRLNGWGDRLNVRLGHQPLKLSKRSIIHKVVSSTQLVAARWPVTPLASELPC